MKLSQRTYVLILVFIVPSLYYRTVNALEFLPGVGVAAEYTDNVGLVPDDTVSDVIAVGYVGAQILENAGPLTYEAITTFNYQHYTQNDFQDQQYLNLFANANWEMIKNHFNWFLSDVYDQRTVNRLDPNTPDNLQSSNAFIFGANIGSQISPRQTFTLTPSFSQYYYEKSTADNKQGSLVLNWNYLVSRLTNVGLNLGVRDINYTETDAFGTPVVDTTFTNIAFIANGQRITSSFSVNLGATNVKRDNGADATGFTGFLYWVENLSALSTFQTLLSTDLTNSSYVSYSAALDPINGDPNDVQITTDVIRNNIFSLIYLRQDGLIASSIYGNYREVRYSESLLNSIDRNYGANLNYPITQLLLSGVYVNYVRSKQLDTARIDERYIVGSNLRYNFTRKWYSLFDVKYRKRGSTDVTQNFDEFSVYATLVYGFGAVNRPTRTGGF